MTRNKNLRIIGKRGRLYLPETLLKGLRLGEGSIVQVSGHNGAVVLVPMDVSPALNPFEQEERARKEKLADMTTRELFELAAAAAAAYQERQEEE